MIEHRFNKWVRQISHPSDKELFLYQEGELDKRTDETIRKHLHGCWSCTAKVEETGRSIARIMRYRDRIFASRTVFPPMARKRFVARLSRVASEMRGHGLYYHLSRPLGSILSLRFSLLGFAAASSVVCLMTMLLWLRLGHPPIVSAKEVLQRSEIAENVRAFNPSTPVVYQKLRVRRSMPAPQQDDVVTWEIWNDSLHSRFSQRVEHGNERQLVDSNLQSYRESKFSLRNSPGVSVLAELEEIYTLNRMDFRRPLSLNAHPSWRESVEHDLVEVKETQLSDATKGVWLSKSTVKPASQNQVVRAEMLVRATDWHAIEQRLSVRKKDNIQYYALTELSFNLLAPNWMPLWSSSNFSVPFQTSPLPALRPSGAYLTSQLLEDEILVHHGLHRVAACLGEQIEIVPTKFGHIEIRGVVESVQRKAELLDALGDIRDLEMKIRTTDEVSGSASTLSEPSDRRQAGSIDQLGTSVQAKRLPIEDYLERFVQERPLESGIVEGNRKDRAALTPRERKLTYMNRVISTSELAMAHGWALRRLAEAFPLGKLRPLHVPYSWMLQDMLDDHSKAIGQQINIMTELIQPLLSQFCSLGPQEVISSGDDLFEEVESADLTGAMRLFRSLKRIEGLTLSIFSENESQNELFRADAQKLLSSVLKLQGNLDALRHQITREFTEKSYRLVSTRRTE